MQGDWSQQVHREYTGGEVKFDFPARPLGRAKLFGVFLIGFSVLFDWGPAHSLWHTIQQWTHETPAGPGKFFALFDVPFVIAGLVPMVVGLLIIFGRCRVEWKDGQLRATEILGLARWTRRMPRKPIQRLEVAAATSANANSAPRQFENFSGLAVVFQDGSTKVLVFGYPKTWLLEMAEELKGYVGEGTTAKVEVVETTSKNKNDEDFPDRPAGCLVQVAEQSSGIRISIPPAGLWRGSKGLFFFALFWCGFMLVFTFAILFSAKREGPLLAFVLFLLGFWGIGFGLLAGAINMGRRTAEFVVESNRLEIETKGLFGSKRKQWTRDEISAIRADYSGIEVNDRPVLEIQIHPRSGKKTGFLAGRNEAELRWIATLLRHALNVPARIQGS